MTRLAENLYRAFKHKHSYYPLLSHAIGDAEAALLLHYYVVWIVKGIDRDEDGWVYASEIDLRSETGLTYHKQAEARSILTNKGILEHKRDELRGLDVYRVNVPTLWSALDTLVRDRS